MNAAIENSEQEVYVSPKPYDEEVEPEVLLRHFQPGSRTLPTGFQVANFLPLTCDIILDKDVEVTLRDGVKIYVDVFRPKGATKVPAIVAWSPYGKSRGHADVMIKILGLLGMDMTMTSGLMKFEGPDPAFWCAQGYAVCHPDARGAYTSEGDIRLWSRREGEDFHDVIEWLGVQDWCNGKIGTSGNSYLAISQWFVAAERPPHLAAIAPWEGMSDVYRDLVLRGGIPDYPFPERLCGNLMGKGLREDFVAEAERYPLMNKLWSNKAPDFEKIAVPAYVVGSYSNSIHTQGTFRGWRRMGSSDKWFRIHNTMEWPDYYEEKNVADLLRFFDRYLKGVNNGWESTPKVRYSLLGSQGQDRTNIPANEFPPTSVTPGVYYLEAGGALTGSPPPEASTTYDAAAGAQVEFHLRVETTTEFVGYPKAVLWVESDGSDDMDVFVFLQKLDSKGSAVEWFTVPNHGPMVDNMTKAGGSILKYKGSNGRLRASMRHLDPATTESIPVHTFDRVEKLHPGEIVSIEIDMFPMGMTLRPGEQLRFIVSGRNLYGGVMPGTDSVPNFNRGRHVIHTGGRYASYLRVPQQPSAGVHQ